jgi:hypothetical protein
MDRLEDGTGRAPTKIGAVTGLSTVDDTFGLDDLLRLVHEFGSMSLGLVAWEHLASEEWVRPAWDEALDERLLKFARVDPVNGEAMYTLSRRGRSRIGEPPLSVAP